MGVVGTNPTGELIPVCPLLAEWLRPVDGVAASSLSRIIANTA